MGAAMDPRVARGMEAQLRHWRTLLAGGAARVGWKIGLNDPRVQRHFGLAGCVVGHLTLATALVPRRRHSLAGGTRVGAEPEVAIHLGRDVPPGADRALAGTAIIGLGAALELVDIDGPLDDLEQIVARNTFHRGVLIGPTNPDRAGGVLADVTARVLHNAEEVAAVDAAAAVGDVPGLVRFAADFLGACGERLLAGDWILSGALTPQVWVQAGDVVGVDLGPLGSLSLGFTA